MTGQGSCTCDGHTYERGGIAQWLTNNDASRLTKEEFRNRELLANHQLKSQIEQWGEEQKGEAARQKKPQKIDALQTSDEVTAMLSAMSEFVAETETLIPAAQLKRIGKMLDEEL